MEDDALVSTPQRYMLLHTFLAHLQSDPLFLGYSSLLALGTMATAFDPQFGTALTWPCTAASLVCLSTRYVTSMCVRELHWPTLNTHTHIPLSPPPQVQHQ